MAEGVRSSGNPVPRTKAWIGCAGWSIPRHEAPRFPPQGSHLERYSQIFNACEINSSFYRSHKIATWERWANSVPAEFRFAVKAPKTITHEERLDCDSQLLPAFLREISALNSKLGPYYFSCRQVSPAKPHARNDSSAGFANSTVAMWFWSLAIQLGSMSGLKTCSMNLKLRELPPIRLVSMLQQNRGDIRRWFIFGFTDRRDVIIQLIRNNIWKR
jgi:hypothetical protein